LWCDFSIFTVFPVFKFLRFLISSVFQGFVF
jgi:hypothetical protein